MSHLTPPSEADSPGVRGPKACVTCARAKVKCIFDAEAIICTRFVRGRLIRIRLLIRLFADVDVSGNHVPYKSPVLIGEKQRLPREWSCTG